MVKYRIDLYIGSDNDSKKISELYLEKLKKWANEIFPDGYTLFKGEGYYNGISEESVILYSFMNYDVSLEHPLERLKKELNQESILFVKTPVQYELV